MTTPVESGPSVLASALGGKIETEMNDPANNPGIELAVEHALFEGEVGAALVAEGDG